MLRTIYAHDDAATMRLLANEVLTSIGYDGCISLPIQTEDAGLRFAKVLQSEDSENLLETIYVFAHYVDIISRISPSVLRFKSSIVTNSGTHRP